MIATGGQAYHVHCPNRHRALTDRVIPPSKHRAYRDLSHCPGGKAAGIARDQAVASTILVPCCRQAKPLRGRPAYSRIVCQISSIEPPLIAQRLSASNVCRQTNGTPHEHILGGEHFCNRRAGLHGQGGVLSIGLPGAVRSDEGVTPRIG